MAAVKARRNRTRSRRRPSTTLANTFNRDEEYSAAKKSLRDAINASKRRCWKKLIEDIDNDVYGQGYKLVMKSLKMTYAPLTLTDPEKDEQVRRLFPDAPALSWEKTPVTDIPSFTLDELLSAANRLKNGKAPRRDGIPVEVIKSLVKVASQYTLDVLNGLLRTASFPTVWKEAKLVLVEKPKKTPQQIPTYRPLCLIDSIAKLFEQMLLARIAKDIDEGGGLSIHQHGFRRGHSTVMAVEEVLQFAKEAHRESRESGV